MLLANSRSQHGEVGATILQEIFLAVIKILLQYNIYGTVPRYRTTRTALYPGIMFLVLGLQGWSCVLFWVLAPVPGRFPTGIYTGTTFSTGAVHVKYGVGIIHYRALFLNLLPGNRSILVREKINNSGGLIRTAVASLLKRAAF